jgi:hypothetical protein
MRILAALAMIMLIGLASHAGELVTYQGRLTDETGEPVSNGNYALTFSLWDDSAAGTMQWSETHASVPVTDGLFSVNLGKDGSLDAAIFETEPLFLQIRLGLSEVIEPRTRLTSAPTAVAAKKVAGDLQTGDGYLNLNSAAGEIAFSMTTGEKGQADFRMYNINPGYLEQMNLSMSTDDYGGHLRLYPTGEIQTGPAFTIGLEPTPFRYPYLSFYDPSGSFPDDPSIKMGVEPSPFMEMTEQSIGYGDRPMIRMGFDPTPFHHGYLAFKNPDVFPPPKLMEIGVNDSTGEWESKIKMRLAHLPEFPTPKDILTISAAPSTGASIKMATPLPEPPVTLVEMKVEEVAGPTASYGSYFNMYSMDPGDDGRETFEISNTLTDGISLKMFNPQPEPPAVYFEVGADPASGPSLGFFDDIGQVMGLDPSPFNEGFSVKLMDPGDDGKLFEVTGNHVNDEVNMYLIDPVDERVLLSMSSNPSSGPSLRMFNPQPEPPAILFDLSVDPFKSSDDVVMKLSSWDGLYQTELNPGRAKVGHPTNDLYPRSELDAGSDSVTFLLQGNSVGDPAPTITMMSSSTEAKIGIGTTTPSEPLVVGDDLTYFSGNLITVGDANATSYAGISFGQNADNRGWMIYDNEDDYIYFGTKEDGVFAPNSIFIKSGDLGIGTSSMSADLHVVGDICYTGSIGTCSDLRYKKDIKTLDNALDRVGRLRGVSFNWKKDEFPQHEFSDENQVGLIAQEVKEVFPEVVSEDNDGYFNIDYTKLAPLLIEAIKELKQENEELKESNENLIRRIEKLEAQ